MAANRTPLPSLGRDKPGQGSTSGIRPEPKANRHHVKDRAHRKGQKPQNAVDEGY